MNLKLTAIGALALIPSLVVAQQTTSDTTKRDTTITTTSEGQLAEPSSSNLGLSSDQVKELQKAINDNGCDAGPVTGTIDAATQKGIDCIREAKNIQSTDINDVLQALGLSFTAKSAQGNAMSDTTDTTSKSDTSTTWRTDSGAVQSDTSTMAPDTSAVHDSSMVHDSTAVPPDTTTVPRDTTSSTMPSMPTTTTTVPDTSRGKPMEL